MSFEEKSIWVQALVTIGSFLVYASNILGRAHGIRLSQVPYVATMLWTIGGAIVAMILGHILLAILWPREADKADVRDREIGRFGEYVGQSFIVVGGLAALGLSMARIDHFWIANAVYLCFHLSALLGSATKIVAYRWGFQSC